MTIHKEDRELLELAAKAAGIDIHWNAMVNGYVSPISYYKNAYEFHEWNPLDDDGDEARLEAELLLTVVWDHVGVTVGGTIYDGDVIGGEFEAYQTHGGDRKAARRRAGVRAAAEIGRRLK